MEEDKLLYKEFLDGNKDALNEIINKYRIELMHFIQNFVNDSYAAEDISQEVFVYLLQHKEVYDFKYSFRTYLYTIAKSRALNYMKVKKRIVFIEDNVDTPENALVDDLDLEENLFRKEQNIAIRKAMKKLKKEYQIAIELADFRRMSYDEIAVIMGKSMPQVKALIHNARKRLGKLLEKESEV